MKNYKLWKFRILKTGLVFGVNKFGWIWVEFWFKGYVKTVRLDKTEQIVNKYEQKFHILVEK